MAYRHDPDALRVREQAVSRDLEATRAQLRDVEMLREQEQRLERELEGLRRALRANELLGRIRVASPCPADWNQMAGDDRVRFCDQCRKSVYNLSAMTTHEAEQLVCEREGDLCARFYRRKDGTILTADCPEGLRRKRRRRRIAAGAMAGALAAAGLAAATHHQGMVVSRAEEAMVRRALEEFEAGLRQGKVERVKVPRVVRPK